jgi:hypothetical protein
MNFRVRPLGRMMLFTFKNTFLAHLILQFVFSSIDVFFVRLSSFPHQQPDHIQNLLTFFGQVITILVEL